MNIDKLTPYERQTYLDRIEQVRNHNVIADKGFLDLYGHTESGEFILGPNSYSRGYRDSFLPANRRPYLVVNLFGVFGKLSDGSWIFIPSYNRGSNLGTQRQNDLKFEVLAEGERRLYQEMQLQKKELEEQKKSQSDIERQLNEALRKIEELESERNEKKKEESQ